MRCSQLASSRPGVVVVATAVVLVALVGFASLAIDLGYLYNVRGGLQRCADSAAMAAAGKLANLTQANINEVRQLARDYALHETNRVLGTEVFLDAETDVEFGRAEFVNDQLEFTVTNSFPNAVRVVVTAEDAAGAGLSLFINLTHSPTSHMRAEAIAVLIPRDVAIVADLSGSHTDDSELRHYKDTQINLDEVFDALHNNSFDTLPKKDAAGFTSTIDIQDLGNGFSRVTVSLTSDASTSTPALSHVTVGLPDSALGQALATATSTSGYPVESGVDPTTGLSGLKFDETTLGENGVQETEELSFEVPTGSLLDDAQSITVGTKAGQSLGIESHSTTAWGALSKWGTETITTDYDPTTDDGLRRLPYKANWNDSELEAQLVNRGYSPDEVSALMSRAYDRNGAYDDRVAVALGLADWRSGKAGGRGEKAGASGGNGNNFVGGSELTWRHNYPFSGSGGSWGDYINGYMKSSSTKMAQANSNFRYRMGAKTFTNYLLEKREKFSETPELAGTPVQPMQAVKDAVQRLTEVITQLDTDDHLSLEIYGTTAHHRVDLTPNYSEILTGANGLLNMQAGHFDSYTNMGGGLGKAITELTGPNARLTAHKVAFLLTDGLPNRGPNGEYSIALGAQYARDQVQAAVDQGIRVYTISVGAGADQTLMQELADLGNGKHYHASGSAIDDYTTGLQQIFETLGGARPVVLVK